MPWNVPISALADMVEDSANKLSAFVIRYSNIAGHDPGKIEKINEAQDQLRDLAANLLTIEGQQIQLADANANRQLQQAVEQGVGVLRTLKTADACIAYATTLVTLATAIYGEDPGTAIQALQAFSDLVFPPAVPPA
jgi:hypothetical protein